MFIACVKLTAYILALYWNCMRKFSSRDDAPFLSSLALQNLLHDCLYQVRRDREAYSACGSIRLGIHCGQCWDTDELSLQINQSPTTVPRIHGSIGLDSVGDGSSI